MTQTASAPRLTFKPHLKAHVLSEREVALIGETRQFALRGHGYAVLAPLLDGTRSAEEIVAAVGGELSPELAYFALERLKARGYTTEVSATEQAPWRMWRLATGEDQVVGATAASAAHVAISTLGIAGDTARALASVIGGSVRLAEPGAAFEVCLVDDYLRPELAAQIETALAEGRSVLPIRPVGVRIWLGPLCRPEDPPDWAALMARLRANRAADAAALDNGAAFPIVPAVSTPETLALGLSLAAVAAVQCASGRAPKTLESSLWTFDTRTFEVQTHPLPPAMRKPERVEAGGARPIDLFPDRKTYTTDGGHRVCSPEETLGRLSHLVSAITGVVGGIEKLSSAPGVHVYGAMHRMAGSPSRNRVLGQPSGAAGKGASDIQARASCLAEAVERYSCGFFEDVPRRTARLDEVGPAAIHPHDIMLFGSRQYQDRDAWNRQHGEGFNWIPEPFDAESNVEWTPVWSLTRRQTRWVPTALCYFGYDPSTTKGVPRFARACSNGCASGNTLQEAIMQGLFELVERDAFAVWWYNRVRRPAIDLASFREPFFDEMRKVYADRGRTLHVLDLRHDLGIPAAAAVSWRTATGGEICFGAGCHLDSRLAVSRALSELNQTTALDEHIQDALPTDEREAAAAAWKREATVENQAYVVPRDDKVVEAGELEDRSSDDLADDIRHCIDHLDRLGYETLVLDHTRPDIGFPTARVIVPGLRHFWARLAPGRLYDVPAALGWLDRALREDELNPIPYFM